MLYGAHVQPEQDYNFQLVAFIVDYAKVYYIIQLNFIEKMNRKNQHCIRNLVNFAKGTECFLHLTVNSIVALGNYAERIGAGGPVYLAAVLEYLTAEILELAGNACRDNKRTRIIPRHVLLAVKNDEELSRLLSNVTISSGGVLPNINELLLPKKSSKVDASSQKESQEY